MMNSTSIDLDVGTLLVSQHHKIFQLFEQLRSPEVHLGLGQEDHGQGGAQHYTLAHEIIGWLSIHTEGVHRRLLPVIRRNSTEGATMSDESVRTDDDMLSIARTLDTLEVSAPTFSTTVGALHDAFERHVRREEDLFCPIFRDTLSQQDSRRLGRILLRAEFNALAYSEAGETFAGQVLSGPG